MTPAENQTASGGTALILSGGGPVGIAWEAGMIAGLRAGGVDLARVDTIVGTSAGSIVGAHLALLGSVDELYAAQTQPFPDMGPAPDITKLGAAVIKARVLHRSVPEQNKSIAKSARGAEVMPEADWLRRIAERLPAAAAADWPERDLRLTATDCESGEVVVWTRERGVPLPVAVASSCAVPILYPPVHIGEHVYMDGGMTSPTNALLAAGFARVIILDSMARLLGSQGPLEREAAELEQGGSRVLKFIFDDATAKLGANLMDVSNVAAIARAGHQQAMQWLTSAEAAGDLLEGLRI